MKDNKYTVEESNEGIVREPVAAVAYQIETAGMVDFDDYMPISGPKTAEEAIADIDQSERDFAEGSFFSWCDVRQMIEDKIRNRRDA